MLCENPAVLAICVSLRVKRCNTDDKEKNGMSYTGELSGLTHWGREKWPTFRRRHFKMHFLNKNTSISINISLKFVPDGRITNIPSLVQIMAWRRLGDKPLSEPMMVSLLTHICVTRLQWVNKCWCYEIQRKNIIIEKQNKKTKHYRTYELCAIVKQFCDDSFIGDLDVLKHNVKTLKFLH